jgi:hypothetical protein
MLADRLNVDARRPHSIVVPHDDDWDGVLEDAEMNWFNVESEDVSAIAANQKLGRILWNGDARLFQIREDQPAK